MWNTVVVTESSSALPKSRNDNRKRSMGEILYGWSAAPVKTIRFRSGHGKRESQRDIRERPARSRPTRINIDRAIRTHNYGKNEQTVRAFSPPALFD